MTAFHALDGTAIVMDPWTGEILAMANLPGLRSESLLEVRRRRSAAIAPSWTRTSRGRPSSSSPRRPRSSRGRSRLRRRFPARDTLEVGGRTIHNAEDGFMAGTGGSETLEEIIEYSHNVGAAEVGMSIGAKTFYEMERSAGFGAPSGVGLARRESRHRAAAVGRGATRRWQRCRSGKASR